MNEIQLQTSLLKMLQIDAFFVWTDVESLTLQYSYS